MMIVTEMSLVTVNVRVGVVIGVAMATTFAIVRIKNESPYTPNTEYAYYAYYEQCIQQERE